MPNDKKKKSNRPVHKLFNKQIVNSVYGPLVRALFDSQSMNNQIRTCGDLQRAFNKKHSCSVSFQTVREWLKILELEPTVSWNLPAETTAIEPK